MATQPVLGGTTLPWPDNDGYQENTGYRGAGRIMADGSVVFDVVNTSLKRRFTLTWSTLTASEKATVETAFATVRDSSASFTAPTGTVYTVTRDDQTGDLDMPAKAVNGVFLFQCTLVLRED